MNSRYDQFDPSTNIFRATKDGIYQVGNSEPKFFSKGEILRQHHDLKVAPYYFDAIYNGRKTFEIRYNDRNFTSSDTVKLKEWTEEEGYSGRELEYTIGFVLPLEEITNVNALWKYVVFSLLDLK